MKAKLTIYHIIFIVIHFCMSLALQNADSGGWIFNFFIFVWFLSLLFSLFLISFFITEYLQRLKPLANLGVTYVLSFFLVSVVISSLSSDGFSVHKLKSIILSRNFSLQFVIPYLTSSLITILLFRFGERPLFNEHGSESNEA
jgi:hypothetical protein